VTHTVLAATGGAAPAGGRYITFFHVVTSERGRVAFDAFLGGPSTSGVFAADRDGTSVAALGGDPDPAAANFGFVNNPFVTARGDVLFDVDSMDTFRSDRRGTSPIVRDGDPAPGGGTLTPLAHNASDRGSLAFLALVNGALATTGIFRTDGAETIAIARDDFAPPTGGSFLSFSEPTINTRGQVAFVAAMSGGSSDFAVLRGDGNELTPVFASNRIAPGGGVFQDFGDPAINRHGQVAAVGQLENGGGLFLGDGLDDAVAIALDGQPTPAGGTYARCCSSPLTLNDRGELAFHVGLTGTASDRGIFVGDGRHTRPLALTHTIAPGTTGTFASFRDIKLGNDGRVAFIGTLTLGVGGVDLTNNVGIWIGSSASDLQLVARTGQLVDGQVLVALPTAFGQFDMNDEGVVWIGTFPSRATAVVFSRVRGERDGQAGSSTRSVPWRSSRHSVNDDDRGLRRLQ
jgi:hypothetical protein